MDIVPLPFHIKIVSMPENDDRLIQIENLIEAKKNLLIKNHNFCKQKNGDIKDYYFF